LQHLAVVAGECQPIGGGGLHPLVPLLGTMVDRAVEGGPLETARLFGRRAGVLAAIDPAVSRVPGYADIPPPQDLPADAARARLLADFRETVAAFAEERPILLVLDDLQWADALTLEFFQTTPPEFFEQNALLVIGTYRSDEQSEVLRDILAGPGMTQIQLARLDTSAVGSMVGDMLALSDPPRGFVDFVATHSEGNPFFVAEYLRTAVAERLLKRTTGRWVFGDGAIEEATYANLSVPASLRELVGRRLAGLPDAAQRVAQIAAVLGRESDAALLLAASGMPETDAMDAIRVLAARQVLDRAEGGRYRFLHDKLRETAYAAIPSNRRAELHRRAAESLESVYSGTDEFFRLHGSLAFHYENAGDRPRAIDYREKAAEHAARAFADREVVDHLTSALRLDDEQGRRIDAKRRNAWRTSVGIAHRALGELDEGRAQLEASLAELGQPVPAKSLLGVVPHALRELTLRRALASPPVSPRHSDVEAERALNAYNFIAMIAYHQSDVPAQLFSTFAALRLAPRVGPSPPAAQLYAAAGNVLGFIGLDRLAWRYAHLSHQIAEASGHELSVGIVHQYSGHLAAFLGEMATFDADILRALDVYTRVGHHRFREEALTNLGHLQCLRGELAESLQTWREIERSGRARADVQTTSWGMLGQARVMALMGGTDEALARFEAAVLNARDDLSQIEHLGARALTFAQKGIEGRAREDIASVLRLLEQSSKTSYTSIWAYSNAVEALFQIQPETSRLSSEDLALARRLIATFRKFVRIIRLARPRLQLWIGVLDWHTGRPSTARRAWKRALEGARRIGLPFDEALTHFWIGRCSADAEGASHLAEAVRAFQGMQAEWYTKYAKRLLEERSSK
jgi:tetratricopeptide (TPR) repeat protein